MQPDATLADVWPTLKKKQEFCANCAIRLKECQDDNENAWVRLGVAGTGQWPGYRICFDSEKSEKIFGSYFHSGKTLPEAHAATTPGGWSSKRMSLDEFQSFIALNAADLV
jgi:hypothetical protein